MVDWAAARKGEKESERNKLKVITIFLNGASSLVFFPYY